MTGFWDQLGYDEGGLPAHLPMGVDPQGRGPMEPGPVDHYECWCPDPACPLTIALKQAWKAGIRQRYKPKIHMDPHRRTE